MRTRAYFVTGTDTGSGKTLATLSLMEAFKTRGEIVGGMKPVASGCARGPEELISDDALQIQAHCSQVWPYSTVNPVALEAPCAPDFAAAKEGRQLTPSPIMDAYADMRRSSGVVIVEGIGGWLTPFSGRTTMADLVRAMAMPAILVVGLRLGCINHALLTQAAIRRDQVELAGWIANHVDPLYPYAMETVTFLKDMLEGAFLGEIPYLENGFEQSDTHVNVLPLLQQSLP